MLRTQRLCVAGGQGHEYVVAPVPAGNRRRIDERCRHRRGRVLRFVGQADYGRPAGTATNHAAGDPGELAVDAYAGAVRVGRGTGVVTPAVAVGAGIPGRATKLLVGGVAGGLGGLGAVEAVGLWLTQLTVWGMAMESAAMKVVGPEML